MAIGDTVNAGLMRVDFSPIARAGEAQARANQAFGDAIGGVIDKFYQKKKEKAEKEQLKQAYLKLGMPEEVADAAKNDKDLANQFINKMNADRNYSLEMEKFNQAGELRDLQRQQIMRNMERQESADQLKGEELMAENQFLQTLPSLITSPQAQRQADIARPGLPALGNADTRNRFLQSQLENPRNQVPVMNLNDRDFLNQFKDDPQQIKRALAFIEKRRENQKPQKIARTITVEDGQGGFTQIGVDEAGNPVRDFGPPKPSGMYPTPEEQAKGKEDILSVENANDFVNKTRENSLESAKSIRPATRALTLLEKGDLDTGGIAELKTNTIAMLDSLGIPIDKETMDKVANTQNFRAEVGKFLFENISNTKGSISEKEMDIFAKISPGLQMTPEANKVLLQYVIKKAERDKDRVKFIQDMRRKGVSIVEQRNRLEDYMIENDLSEVLSPIAGQPSEQTPQNTFNLNGQNVLGEVVGTKPNGDKLIKVNGQIFVQPAQ
jgi:hypothetical protein